MIRKLVAQYFQLVDPSDLALPDGPVLVRPDVQTALYERMFAETVFPLPPANYRARVLKLILARIEASIRDPEEDEILDDLMSSWSTLVATPKTPALEQAQQLELVKYTAPAQPDTTDSSIPERTVITSESRGLIYGSGTTGFRTWEAALHLGSFLATKMGESLIRGKRVIELGAGTGFLSLLCARHLGAHTVVATDRETTLIENMDRCASHNQIGIAAELPFSPAVWEWGTPLDVKGGDAVSEWNQFDVALGADLIYDADLVPLLLSTVQDLFDNYGLQHFIISATVRNEDTFGTFLSVCESHAFTVEQVPFESVPSESQTGFFHSTSTPIRTYRILPPS